MIDTVNQKLNASGTPPVILVVDDDIFIHQILRELLGMLGITTVHCAADGRKALKLMGKLQTPPDYLFCDVFMPDVDGIEFLAQVADLRFAGSVVIMSAGDAHILNLSREIASANGLKVVGTLIKPINLQQLSAVLGRHAG
jgi:CheY-like chemotaxis protein